jgi:hypothetical protein
MIDDEIRDMTGNPVNEFKFVLERNFQHHPYLQICYGVTPLNNSNIMALDLQNFMQQALVDVTVHAKIGYNEDTDTYYAFVFVVNNEIVSFGLLGEAFGLHHQKHPGESYINILQKTPHCPSTQPSIPTIMVRRFASFWEYCGFNALRLWAFPPQPHKDFLFRGVHISNDSTPAELKSKFYNKVFKYKYWHFGYTQLFLHSPPAFQEDVKSLEEELKMHCDVASRKVEKQLQQLNKELESAGACTLKFTKPRCVMHWKIITEGYDDDKLKSFRTTVYPKNNFCCDELKMNDIKQEILNCGSFLDKTEATLSTRNLLEYFNSLGKRKFDLEF